MQENGHNPEFRNFAPPIGVETLRHSETGNFVSFPNLLIRNMKRLGLTSAEFVFVAFLISDGFSWEGNCVVAASLKEMHRVTGLATGTIHKAKDGLVKKGLVQILNTRNKERTNTYNLLPLRERLAEFAEWKLPAPPEPTVDERDWSPQA